MGVVSEQLPCVRATTNNTAASYKHRRAEHSTLDINMEWLHIFSLFLLFTLCPVYSRKVKLGGKDCEFKGSKICNGAVTKEIGTKLVKVCTDGKIKVKTRKSIGEGFALVGRDTGEGRDCVWYGTTFCDGDLVEVRGVTSSVLVMSIWF